MVNDDKDPFAGYTRGDVNTHIDLARMHERVSGIEDDIARIDKHANERLTPLDRFTPIEKSVFGIIALIAAALVGIAVAHLFGGKL
jgi:hypothetical protein